MSWQEWYGKFMYIFVLASQAWLLIQVVKLYTHKDTSGLSVVAFSLLVFNQVAWVVYSAKVLEPRNNVILLNSTLSLILSTVMLIGILIY